MEKQKENIMKNICFLCSLLLMCSCTYSITSVHTEGQATDIVDEAQSASPSTKVTIPLTK